jgi:hypothetical protein
MLSRFDGRSDFSDFSLLSCAKFGLRNVLSSSSFIVVNSVSRHLAFFARNPSSCVFRIQTLPTLEFETFQIQPPTKQYLAALSTIYECMPPPPIMLAPARLPPFRSHGLNSLLHGRPCIFRARQTPRKIFHTHPLSPDILSLSLSLTSHSLSHTSLLPPPD